VTLCSGPPLLVKQELFAPLTRGKAFDLLRVEASTLQLLHSCGCPVPRLVGTDPDTGCTVTEWSGDQTLDDACQGAAPGGLGPLTEHVIEGFLALEAAFHRNVQALRPMAFPGCDARSVRESWHDLVSPPALRLDDILDRPEASTGLAGARIVPLLERLVQTLASAPMALGATDYNARNIVVGGDGDVRFLEFAKLGWDWPERRLVQYATSLGAGRQNGRFVSLLTPEAATRYAVCAAPARGIPAGDVLARLDGHLLVFYLLAASRLLGALADGSSEHAAALLAAWPNAEDRLDQVRSALSCPLSSDPDVGELRACFAPQ